MPKTKPVQPLHKRSHCPSSSFAGDLALLREVLRLFVDLDSGENDPPALAQAGLPASFNLTNVGACLSNFDADAEKETDGG